METIYTAAVTATGGREGHIKSDNGIIDMQIKFPTGMGGKNDDYANPELLFAAGYSACFDGALNLALRTARVKTGETSVTAKVSIGKVETGLQLAAELLINIPGISLEEAKSFAEKAHQTCPYSKATRGNIDVTLTVTNK